jgi:LuxR family maltose regulon positive regulatory protein
MLAERTRLSSDTPVIEGAAQRLAELARGNPAPKFCSRADIRRYAALAAGRLAITRRQHHDAITNLHALAQEAAGCQRYDFALYFALWADTLRSIALWAANKERDGLLLLEDVAGRARRGGMQRCVLDQANLLPAAAQEHLRRFGIYARGPSGNMKRGGALAPREQEVLRLIAAGMSNKQIARALGLGPETVKTYLKSAFARLSVQGRVQAVLKAQSLGLLPTP